MKCTLAQAGQVTDTWRSCASFDVSSSQCCTFIPVWGHLNKIGRSMARMMPAYLDRRYSVSIRRQSDWLSLAKDASFRLIVSANIGVKEIERLIQKLEIDKEILAEQFLWENK